jgi:predicted DNA-binding transcriptional regulator AlpA
MMTPEPGARTPVKIRGITFPSVQAAAEHFGVHRITVWRWLSKGQFDGSRKLKAKLKRIENQYDQK